MKWDADIVNRVIQRRWPELRTNLLRMEELDAKMRDAGMEPPPMPPILTEALRIAKSEPQAGQE